jgi:hypothetical protein
LYDIYQIKVNLIHRTQNQYTIITNLKTKSMMKNYSLLKLCILLISMSTLNTEAQVMNGVYTIDNTQVSSATNFTSFTAFAARINTAGVSGPVTVNVGITSGPYNEQVNFVQAPGISATNSVTVNGNGRTISFNSVSSTSLHTLMLSGADYMTFDNLTIIGLGTTYALTVHLWNQSSFNQFTNCRISAPQAISSTNIIPFSMSGSGTSATTSGDHGNSNIVNTCTITGGYYAVSLYGLSGSPYNLDNRILNSYIAEWYSVGIYEIYDRSFIIRGNIIERLNLTTATTTYGMQLNNQAPLSIIEGNYIRRLFDNMQTNANTCYAIYGSSSGGLASQEMVIRNNIISDIRFNGPFYGVYLINGSYFNVDHNTISLDDPNSTYTGTSYGLQQYCQYLKIRNNIFSMKRGGSANSSRIGISIGATVYLTGFDSRNNVFNINGASGTNYIGLISNNTNTFYPTLNTWQVAINQDLLSQSADPVFTNPSGGNYLPTSQTINNMAYPLGVVSDFSNSPRSLVMPDPGALEFYNTPCNSTPPITGITTPSTTICPGNTVALILGSNTFTATGYSVQWYSGTLNIGPFTSVSGGTLNTLTSTPINLNTYYNAVVTCTNTGQTATTTIGSVLVAQTTTNTVPYYESFETPAYNGLPNCSWTNTQGNAWPNFASANFLQLNNRVPRTGNGYAIFTGTPAAATSYFYSNGIWMEPGITYSASLWYINESIGYNPWTDISMLVGPNQNQTGQQLIASSNGPVASVLYSSLSNTFMVTAPALYYIAVKATSASGNSPYLTWDDLSIIIPCSLNQPALTVSSTKDTICAGQGVNLTASGATTYTWSNSANTPVISVNPNTSTTYFVTGLNALTGCSKSVSRSITVNEVPVVSAIAFPVAVCAGSPANLTAIAANVVSYYWSSGGNGQSTTVLPLANSVYSVTAINAYSCSAIATIQVTTYNKPVVTTTLSKLTICKGEAITITASGASTYSWISTTSGFLFQGASVTDFPATSTVYSVTGTDANGCVNTSIQALPVESCIGLNEFNQSLSDLRVYPNPTSNSLFVETSSNTSKSIEISDISGRVLFSAVYNDQRSQVDIGGFSNGIYYLRVQSENSVSVIKVIKN